MAETISITNRIISIVGFPWSGKSFLAIMMASTYPEDRIFANVDILEDGVRLSKRIKTLEDLELIQFSPIKGVLILDEMGVNVNSRRSMTDANLEFARIAMLGRKKNVDILTCAQLDGMADKYFRDLSAYTFEMQEPYFIKKNHPIFTAKIINRYKVLVKICRFDLIEFTELTGITYNSIENSIMDRTKKDNGVFL